jgi:hypothetical protein
MSDAELAALSALRFNWAPVPDDVWRPLPFHVDGLHPAVVRDIENGLAAARDTDPGSPIGLVMQGQRGSGKTHLLGWTRQQIQAQGGYFFLVGLLDARGFWDSVLGSLLDGLNRPAPDSENQVLRLLRRLSAMMTAPRAARRAVMGETALTRKALDEFIKGLAKLDPHVARNCQDTARALALSVSGDITHRDLAENYFVSGEEAVSGERSPWGMRRTPRSAQEIVQDLSWLLALTGPTVIAVDQIDTLIAQSALSGDRANAYLEPDDDWQQRLVVERVAHGLMSLRQVTRRTLSLVACIPASWKLIKDRATDTVPDRFRESSQLKTISDGALGRAIVSKRFAEPFARAGFTAPFPTWPVDPAAFDGASGFTPRQLLITVDAHIRSCLEAGAVSPLRHLGDPPKHEPHRPTTSVTAVPPADLARFDARFAELKGDADVARPLNPDAEDATMPALLSAGLTAWILERGQGGECFSQDPPPSASPQLHARLRQTLDESTRDQVHWSFRAVSDRHHPNAALARLRKACIAAGLDPQVPKRRLFVLRNGPFGTSHKTREAVQLFEGSHGTRLTVDEADLRILGALATMLKESPTELQAWLVQRRPTAAIGIFREAFGDAGGVAPPEPDPSTDRPTVVKPASSEAVGRAERSADGAPAFTVGYDYDTGEPARLRLDALRKHMTIFAGSGSGKTVLIRRIVEECALQGVSSIVLDPNNDLARLGDGWPAPPAQWRPGDAARSVEYLAGTDVVIWTPRREAGRPLSFQPLPDFRGVRDDPDEFSEAVDAAVAALAPRANITGSTNKATLAQAVLRSAVRHYGERGGSRLKGLIDTLADFPDGVIDLDDAPKIAAGLAQTLTAAMVNDPLFAGSGAPMDPGLLLTPKPGKRARVSVISMVGLPDDSIRQSFVNQLQMALFAWIKRHPARDRPLLGLLIMDEAQTLAPSGAMTACTQSTLALVAQARKYGLGLVFATQAPKGLHNRIPGNATTQFFGLMNSPIQVEAAREMAKAKGGDVPDISRLRTGEFYLAAEGAAPAKLRTPLCLSYHPASPPTAEEVIARARAGSASGH